MLLFFWLNHFLDDREEIGEIFSFVFGEIQDKKKVFWNFLTFSELFSARPPSETLQVQSRGAPKILHSTTVYLGLKFKSSICINHLINDVSFLDCFVRANVTFILVTEKKTSLLLKTHILGYCKHSKFMKFILFWLEQASSDIK